MAGFWLTTNIVMTVVIRAISTTTINTAITIPAEKWYHCMIQYYL